VDGRSWRARCRGVMSRVMEFGGFLMVVGLSC
jgi:hypothetical protein